ncbi:MAG: hypothetical protein ABIS27_14960 [Longimicrobiales bacterium]
MRRLIPLLLLLTACVQDRPRPEPLEDEERANLFVAVRKPANNATVFGNRPLDVEIYALDVTGFRLTGHGYVVRRNGVKLDSVVRRFTARADSGRVFQYSVPDLPTNTQIDISGLAFGSKGEALEGPPVMLVVVRCTTGIPGCQP